MDVVGEALEDGQQTPTAPQTPQQGNNTQTNDLLQSIIQIGLSTQTTQQHQAQLTQIVQELAHQINTMTDAQLWTAQLS